MGMRMDMGFGQHMEMRPSPSLIQFTEILALSGLELQQMIHQVVAENPALELSEPDLCPACGDPLLTDGTCYRCCRGDSLASQEARSLEEPDEERLDLLTLVADQRSLAEHLLIELATVLDEADMPMAEYLVGELDERGFLQTNLEVAANSLGVPVQRVEHVLQALQSVGPLGVGSRTVEECLLSQLDRWEQTGVSDPLARTLVCDHLDALGHGKYSQLARALGAEYDEIVAARDFIRTHLRPYPVAERTDLELWERQTGPGFVAPDVVVRSAKDGEFEIEILDSQRYALSISPLYRELAERLEAGRELDERDGLTRKDRKHIQAQVQRAREFLTYVRERRDTMRRVAAYVMARQADFLRLGPRHLQPLTRAEVAEALDLHESTISRATSGKYVLLPSRRVVPFGDFFKAALSVQDVLREIVDSETRALTDAELAEELQLRGYDVARRTVAKYRNQMRILPSSLR